MNSICIYCGSNVGKNPLYAEAAKEMGVLLAQKNIALVYGGGQVGLMGVVADAVLNSGGKVTGVIPQFLEEREVHHKHLTEQICVETMHERKQIMADLSDAFVALPGGLGTLDELFEIMTWHQLHLHRKPIGLLNVDGYFDALLTQIDRMVSDGFLHPANRDILVVETDAELILSSLSGYKPSEERNWYIDVR
ncbi:MAG: TIGR00730 family Rossman fold protein [Flavobacteriaceae bacterium]|nr:TIGR00730 family Rossman fold protein [Flavobacteriaceae bacterium]